jgi:hypothetical protein
LLFPFLTCHPEFTQMLTFACAFPASRRPPQLHSHPTVLMSLSLTLAPVSL